MTSLSVLGAGLEIFAAVVMAAVLFSCLSDHNSESKLDIFIVLLIETVIIMLVTDVPLLFMDGVAGAAFFQHVLSFMTYVACHFAIVIFMYYVANYLRRYVKMPVWMIRSSVALAVTGSVLWLISGFTGVFYYIDDSGVIHSGDLYWLSKIPGVIILLMVCVFVLYNSKRIGPRNTALIMTYAVFPLMGVPFSLLWGSTPTYLAASLSVLLIYLMIHQDENLKSSEQGREIMKQRAELANSRAKIMMSQIQPHFLYNTLNAIYYLIEKDPKTAQKAVNDFSEYLRMNIDTLSIAEPVEFEKELKHIETYLWIEKLRFDDELNVVYEIGEKDFLVPALSIQPFVENAVKHGICKKEDGGTLWLRTAKTANGVLIEIEDNGVGFDVNSVKVDDGRTHVGVSNSQQRLENMMGAKFTITSEVGVGTKVEILIPNEDAEQLPGKVVLCE